MMSGLLGTCWVLVVLVIKKHLSLSNLVISVSLRPLMTITWLLGQLSCKWLGLSLALGYGRLLVSSMGILIVPLSMILTIKCQGKQGKAYHRLLSSS